MFPGEIHVDSLANPTPIPMTTQDVEWARCRPPQARTPLPRVGDVVFYRHDPNGPLSKAEVTAVDLETKTDYNVYRFVLDERRRPVVVGGRRVMELNDDPWPSVRLTTRYGVVDTREARVDGSPGWLPRMGARQ